MKKYQPYPRVTRGGKTVYVHRLVWEAANGPIPAGMCIDHIDGDRQNNVLSNLRLVSMALNGRNMRMRTSNTSGVCGVYRTTTNGHLYWKAQWYGADGVKRGRAFSIATLGEEGARGAAIALRTQMVAGLGYTERHGHVQTRLG